MYILSRPTRQKYITHHDRPCVLARIRTRPEVCQNAHAMRLQCVMQAQNHPHAQCAAQPIKAWVTLGNPDPDFQPSPHLFCARALEGTYEEFLLFCSVALFVLCASGGPEGNSKLWKNPTELAAELGSGECGVDAGEPACIRNFAGFCYGLGFCYGCCRLKSGELWGLPWFRVWLWSG